jgi:Mor family transcriptional regulator
MSAKTPPKIEDAYKQADKLIDALSLDKEEKDALRDKVHQLIVSVHNTVVQEMRDSVGVEINKTLEKLGYKTTITK